MSVMDPVAAVGLSHEVAFLAFPYSGAGDKELLEKLI
jgi:hypothetical protein